MPLINIVLSARSVYGLPVFELDVIAYKEQMMGLECAFVSRHFRFQLHSMKARARIHKIGHTFSQTPSFILFIPNSFVVPGLNLISRRTPVLTYPKKKPPVLVRISSCKIEGILILSDVNSFCQAQSQVMSYITPP